MGDEKISSLHAEKLAACFAVHARDLFGFGYACVLARGDRALAEDPVRAAFEAAGRAWWSVETAPDRRCGARSPTKTAGRCPCTGEAERPGVFYGAGVSEAPAMRGRNVFVVGGGNSAGQAAMDLARWADQVTVLVRGEWLAGTMSDYLIREIKAAPNVGVTYQVEVVGGAGTAASLCSVFATGLRRGDRRACTRRGRRRVSPDAAAGSRGG